MSHCPGVSSRSRSLGRLGTLALLLLAGKVSPAEAFEASEWTALGPGLWHRARTLEQTTDEAPLAANLFRVDPRVTRLTVLDARRPGRSVARVSTLRQESNAYLVVNGGFFDPEGQPLGLVVGDGREKSPLRKVDQGVFLIAGGKPLIQHAREPLPSSIEVGLQAGPRLVVNGRSLQLKPQASRRTSVCLPGDGTVVLLVMSAPISLSDLAANLARPATSGGLGCWTALNLDGGPSTQLSLVTPEMSLEIEGGWGVPNALAVLPR